MRRLKIASAQFMLKPYTNLDHFISDVIKILDNAKGYDIVVFGEWFTLGLLATEMDISKATYDDIPKVSRFTDDLCRVFSELAVDRNQCIIAGTTVEYHAGKYYDTCFIFMPSGSMHKHRKTHLFPLEKFDWHMNEDNVINVFEYNNSSKRKNEEIMEIKKVHEKERRGEDKENVSVRFGICICYESQIPECSRALALKGAEIIICPSLTLTEAGYNRIRHSCEARCIENQLLVVLSSTIGDLNPFAVKGVGKSAILAPCDKPWPSNGLITDGIMNKEMLVKAEVDIDDIYITRLHGYARTHYDRLEKMDLYKHWLYCSNYNRSKI